MKKLMRKFENNYNQIRTLGVPIEVIFEQNKRVAATNAEECKEIAIAFLEYGREYSKELELRFDDFIEEYYETKISRR